MKNDDLISRQAAIDAVIKRDANCGIDSAEVLKALPSAQPEHLTDDDFETIRIHLSAIKEELCNQHRWKEAEEYKRIIDRFMAFASAQPEITETQVKEYCEKRCLVVLTLDLFQRLKSTQPARKKGRWLNKGRKICCSECGRVNFCKPNFCDECGADMRKEEDNAEKIH